VTKPKDDPGPFLMPRELAIRATIEAWVEELPTAGQSTEDAAEAAGYDCGKNGPNTTNCHFGLFSTLAKTAAWERGKRRAEAAKKGKA
jgi:hypothetical protein